MLSKFVCLHVCFMKLGPEHYKPLTALDLSTTSSPRRYSTGSRISALSKNNTIFTLSVVAEINILLVVRTEKSLITIAAQLALQWQNVRTKKYNFMNKQLQVPGRDLSFFWHRTKV